MTYNETLASYQRLLEANPGKALQIGDDCYAVLINGTLSGAYATLDGAVDLGTIFHFDREAWDAECECWDGDVSGMQTAFCVATPSLVELPPPPAGNGTPNQGKKEC
ncbi:hypothetical protein LUW10_31355 (plasmid) [Pseudomonas veronii]|jgi:hypothetical protein|uniref:Uncharacterized protein n=4 Tax=Pseudomonas TaxID=286 RepID=A0A921T7Q8_9PSED|nr:MULTISPECIES: hypothetical protein [Pseudomonadaceae]HEJ3361410.1 hypothetical protein [Pseudomonas aeruginosa]KWV68369.1 hypothetical protein PFLmoz3_06347 [Pseudomonas fluorescens]MBJ2221365.1 hypothetical protein [Pseudomonas sp. MF7453]NMX41847.1 hypothetical protein [Pseudomonas veronii]NMZ20610.1 hypothetical protein [Pseudomonas rhodesiae]